jgi:hypothetical protein
MLVIGRLSGQTLHASPTRGTDPVCIAHLLCALCTHAHGTVLALARTAPACGARPRRVPLPGPAPPIEGALHPSAEARAVAELYISDLRATP